MTDWTGWAVLGMSFFVGFMLTVTVVIPLLRGKRMTKNHSIWHRQVTLDELLDRRDKHA